MTTPTTLIVTQSFTDAEAALAHAATAPTHNSISAGRWVEGEADGLSVEDGLAETLGLTGFQVTGWFGLLAPAAMPADVVGQLNAECVRILALPELREKLALLGSADTPTQSAREFGAFLAAETDRYARVIRAAGLRLETPSS